MHPLAAKLFHKEIRVFLFGKAENTIPVCTENLSSGVAVVKSTQDGA
jgi:hypothetical protein